MSISRNIQSHLLELSTYYPIVVITGPRQSGKTTLSQQTFPDKTYVSLEPLDYRDYANDDPRGFLDEYREGAIIDEVQYVPRLLSYLHEFVDKQPEAGRFVLTGSQNFTLSQAISQSLAGRCGVLTLLPPSLNELERFENSPDNLFSLLWQGCYPRIYDRQIPAHQWLRDYMITYVQRDVRQISQIGNLNTFTNFMKLCAGSTAQEVNLSRLGSDAGIAHNTAKAWLSVLETAYLVFQIPAWHSNFRKQIIKAPKLHFYDSGLACYLLGIRSPDELHHHPLRGAIFESWVASEIYKVFTNRGALPSLFHYREARGLEIDLLIEAANGLKAIEVKSGATVNRDFFKHLNKFMETVRRANQPVKSWLFYGGDDCYLRQGIQIAGWKNIVKMIDMAVFFE